MVHGRMNPNYLRLATLASLIVPILSQPRQLIIPSQPADAITETQWTSNASGFDFPKNTPINRTSYDWWYFDAVASATLSDDGIPQQPSVAFTFHTTGADGFDLLGQQFPGGILPSGNVVQILVTWPNGTHEDWLLPAGDAVFTLEGDGASAVFPGTGCAFHGAPDLSRYVVTVDAPEQGIVGSLVIESASPPHYPCGPAEAGQPLQTAPGGGWENAIPDSAAIAKFTVRGHELRFTGRGYHDHDFGNRPFSPRSGYACWGHGRVGEYAIVWLSILPRDGLAVGDEYTSAYVARDGTILEASCTAGSILIRPYGDNATCPPHRSTGPPTGYTVTVEIPEGRLEVRAEYLYIVTDAGVYRRFTGVLRGMLGGEVLPEGVALWSSFRFWSSIMYNVYVYPSF